MDNISHSMAGLACGELIHRCLPKEADHEQTRLRHRLLLLSCWLSSNFPDLDLFLTPLLPEPLGYLLHHRGHTHTFLYALPQGVAIYLLLWSVWPPGRRLIHSSRIARLGLALSILSGLVLHLAMDYLNSYGIHPFHPFDSRWFYGDTIFIVEPVFWIAFGVPLIMMLPNRWLRGMLLAALAGILVYFTIRNYLNWLSFAVLLLAGTVLAGLQKKSGMHGISALLTGMMLGSSFVLVQGFASNEAKTALEKRLRIQHPARLMVDAAITPFPANPICWTFVSIESNEAAGAYYLRRGWLSLSAQILPVSSCPASLMPIQIAEGEPALDFLLVEHYEGKLEALRQLQKTNCHVEAWLRFARAPVFDHVQATDMRFSSSARGNFTALRFEDFRHLACADHIPQWDFPRRDLLEGR